MNRSVYLMMAAVCAISANAYGTTTYYINNIAQEARPYRLRVTDDDSSHTQVIIARNEKKQVMTHINECTIEVEFVRNIWTRVGILSAYASGSDFRWTYDMVRTQQGEARIEYDGKVSKAVSGFTWQIDPNREKPQLVITGSPASPSVH